MTAVTLLMPGRGRLQKLWLVPRPGGREYWAEELMAGIAKTRMSDWANQAALRIASESARAADIIDFVRSIAEKLTQARNAAIAAT
ncbi:MAG TPA: hypothetical protein VFE24_09280 [Pirellulales bacterium]|nr:hypothetical protein [Pirellulales bacterium]